MADTAGGSWYFDTRSRALVYRVRNADYFRGGAGTPALARFAVQLVYEDRGRRGLWREPLGNCWRAVCNSGALRLGAAGSGI